MQAAIAQAQDVIGDDAGRDDHHDDDHDDGAAGQGGEDVEEDGTHDDHARPRPRPPRRPLGADEHRAQERDDHDLDHTGLGGAQDLSGARRRRGRRPSRSPGAPVAGAGASHDGSDEARRKGVLPMGLLDKVKAQATAATEMAKDAAAKGQAKMNEAQAKKAADGMLRDLGAAFYATKTGRSTPTTDSRDRPAGHLPAGARVRARPDHAGARVRRGAPTATPAGDGSAAPPRPRPRRRPTRPPRRLLRPRRRRCSRGASRRGPRRRLRPAPWWVPPSM